MIQQAVAVRYFGTVKTPDRKHIPMQAMQDFEQIATGHNFLRIKSYHGDGDGLTLAAVTNRHVSAIIFMPYVQGIHYARKEMVVER